MTEASAEGRVVTVMPDGKPGAIAVIFHPYGFDPEAVIDGERPGARLIRSLTGFRRPARLHDLVLVAPSGRGRTTVGGSLAWPAHLEAVWDVVDELARELRTTRVVAGGLSMGGLEALVFAGLRPQGVAAVWAANPVVDVAAWCTQIMAGPNSALRELGLDQEILSEVGGTPQEVPDAYRQRSATTYAAALAGVRVQLVWSPADTVVPRQEQQHAGKLAGLIREAGGWVDERIVTAVPPAAGVDAGRYAHESCDVWSGAAFLAGVA
jgi:pimeloyl-ACP methyl ester carboxylesterase